MNSTAHSLAARLESYTTTDKDFWSFRGNAARKHTHIYFQYPAMMVPQMQAELLTAALEDFGGIRHVYDPFVGAGTALTESMLLGLDFTGQDINPLAVLLCRAKSIPFFCNALKCKIENVLRQASQDRRQKFELGCPNRQKWFRRDVLVALSRIRRAIRSEESLWARRFLWVALAETVRLSSNSRTTTFKLHVRPKAERDSRCIDPLETFTSICNRNFNNLQEQKRLLAERGHLKHGVYRGEITTILADTANAPRSTSDNSQFDLLLTSPPYGDNVSTVPYGQHSYLPLQWIDLNDIDPHLNASCLSTTHAIDSKSLGGSRAVSTEDLQTLRESSPTYERVLHALRNEPRDRLLRVSAFCRDLEKCVDPILSRLRPGALMIWTIGNRRVAGQIIRLDQILTEFLSMRHAQHLYTICRRIPSKRSAIRNNIAATMRRENVLVMQKTS